MSIRRRGCGAWIRIFMILGGAGCIVLLGITTNPANPETLLTMAGAAIIVVIAFLWQRHVDQVNRHDPK